MITRISVVVGSYRISRSDEFFEAVSTHHSSSSCSATGSVLASHDRTTAGHHTRIRSSDMEDAPFVTVNIVRTVLGRNNWQERATTPGQRAVFAQRGIKGEGRSNLDHPVCESTAARHLILFSFFWFSVFLDNYPEALSHANFTQQIEPQYFSSEIYKPFLLNRELICKLWIKSPLSL